jgi:Mg-chelatase subunit ChlD
MIEEFIFDKIFRNFGKSNRVNPAHQAKPYLISLETALDKAWEEVQGKLYCYELPPPQIKEDSSTSTACINMQDHQITINKGFVDFLSAKGMGYESIFKGILSHEAGHYKDIPWDLKNLLRMLHKASQICGDKKDAVTNYFLDVSLNLNLMLNKNNKDIYYIYKNLNKDSRIDLLLSHVYQSKTGFDFNTSPLSAELKPKLLELEKIMFTQREDKALIKNLERFAELLDDNNEPGLGAQGGNRSGGRTGNGKGNGSGKHNGHGSGAQSYSLTGLDKFGIRAYDKNEIRRALREIAEESTEPSEFVVLSDFVKKTEEEIAKEENKENQGIGKGSGRAQNKEPKKNLDPLIEYYSILAEYYPIRINDKESLFSGKESKRSGLKPWEADNPLNDIDVFNSYGKFMPSITKAINYSGGPVGKQKSKITPDLILMIDSSGSMTNPAEAKSNAVLGAFCAAKEYLKKESRIGVVNFSSQTYAYGFSRDYAKIASNLVHYQDGGTELDGEAIDKLVSSTKKEADIILITDGGIYNLDSVMNNLNDKSNTNRISILYIDGSSRSRSAQKMQHLSDKSKIAFYTIRKEEDIPGVIIKDLTKSGVINI